MGGEHYTNQGGGVNYLCLPHKPKYDKYSDGRQSAGYMFGTEYEVNHIFKGPLQYLFRPLLGKNEFAVTEHMYAFIGPNLDNIH